MRTLHSAVPRGGGLSSREGRAGLGSVAERYASPRKVGSDRSGGRHVGAADPRPLGGPRCPAGSRRPATQPRAATAISKRDDRPGIRRRPSVTNASASSRTCGAPLQQEVAVRRGRPNASAAARRAGREHAPAAKSRRQRGSTTRSVISAHRIGQAPARKTRVFVSRCSRHRRPPSRSPPTRLESRAHARRASSSAT